MVILNPRDEGEVTQLVLHFVRKNAKKETSLSLLSLELLGSEVFLKIFSSKTFIKNINLSLANSGATFEVCSLDDVFKTIPEHGRWMFTIMLMEYDVSLYVHSSSSSVRDFLKYTLTFVEYDRRHDLYKDVTSLSDLKDVWLSLTNGTVSDLKIPYNFGYHRGPYRFSVLTD